MSSSPAPGPDPADAEPLVGRAVGGIGASVVVGALLGASAWFSDLLGFPLGLLIPTNLIGVWLGVAFALGASARTVPTGGARGLVGLMAAVGAYYLLIGILGEGFRAIGASHAATVWGVVALGAGPLLGLAGGVWRHRAGAMRSIAVAVLAAALIGEGLAFGRGVVTRLDIVADPGALWYLGELAIGAVLPFALLRPSERVLGYVATFALGVAAALAIGPFTAFVRAIADTF